MGKKRILDHALIELAEKYNAEGRHAMYALLREKYNYNNTAALFKRMTQYEFLRYNQEIDKFEIKGKPHVKADDVFMSIDELCTPKASASLPQKQQNPINPLPDKEDAMRKLIQDLLGDRLLEMNRYIVLEPAARTMFIDKSLLEKDGYKVVMH